MKAERSGCFLLSTPSVSHRPTTHTHAHTITQQCTPPAEFYTEQRAHMAEHPCLPIQLLTGCQFHWVSEREVKTQRIRFLSVTFYDHLCSHPYPCPLAPPCHLRERIESLPCSWICPALQKSLAPRAKGGQVRR